MIVPVILSYNYLNTSKVDGLWIFYKFFSFAKENNLGIIGREKYLESPSNYKNTWDLNENIRKMYNYDFPDIDFLKENRKYMITNKVEEYIINKNYDWSTLLSQSCKMLEDEIESKINLIEQDKKEKIDIIITWYPFKSLENICQKRNIKCISVEFSSIRKEWYNYTLSSISLNTKYNAKEDYNNISKFNSRENVILTREELIILFSYKQDVMYNLKLLKERPQYEIGYALGLDNDPYEKSFSILQQKDIINELLNNYDCKDILFRQHPQSKTELSKHLFVDNSNNSREFISKCDKLVISLSNIGYEGSLYGRKISYINPDFLSALGKKSNISLLCDSIITLEELNFITFYLYTPFSNIFDKKYLEDFVLKKNNVNVEYKKNVKKVFNDFNIDYKKIKTSTIKERKRYLLKQIHNFSEEEINYIETIMYNRNEILEKEELIRQNAELAKNKVELQNKIDQEQKVIYNYEIKIKKQLEEKLALNNLNKVLNNSIIDIKKQQELEVNQLLDKKEEINKELINILNSKSWKLTKPLRIITGKLKGKK